MNISTTENSNCSTTLSLLFNRYMCQYQRNIAKKLESNDQIGQFQPLIDKY